MAEGGGLPSSFDLTGRIAVITGGAGLLGREHAMAIAQAGGTPVLWDIDRAGAEATAEAITDAAGIRCHGVGVDITDEQAVLASSVALHESVGDLGILINNAANDPKVSETASTQWSRLESFPLEVWTRDIAVGLTGALICSRVLGQRMASRGSGVILNISSDLGLVAPDQRLYEREALAWDEQPVKPVTYSVVKHGLIGLTRYLATYWANQGVRCNALAPGGVGTDQPRAFRALVESRIPLGRMARRDEYRGAVQFLVSDASSYMNGAVVVADGGRTVW